MMVQHDGNVSAPWKCFSMMEMFQHDGGVKYLKIKQQRDGLESVIWNLARFQIIFFLQQIRQKFFE